MSTHYDALVFIGRFSPFHKGHEAVINKALTMTNKVIVLVGSAHSPRTIRDPFTYAERRSMITARYRGCDVVVKPLVDYPYDDNKWIASVRAAVCTTLPWSDFPLKIGLIGHSKDHTSYYLKLFPDWRSEEVENFQGIHSTDIREDLFSNGSHFMSSDKIPSNSLNEMQRILSTGDWWIKLKKEKDLISEYKKSWASAPYEPIFVTTDAVVVQSGHVLLVKRKSAPGMGLWALPGGFLNPNELMEDGVIRELREETKIKVPVPVLKGSIKSHHMFDHPHRSTRGRTITSAYFIELGTDLKLPKVTGADDAEKAVWVPFDQVKREMMFEDHFHIIDWFTNIG